MLPWPSHLASPGEQEVFWTAPPFPNTAHIYLETAFQVAFSDPDFWTSAEVWSFTPVDGKPGPQKRGSANLPGSHFYRWQWTCHHANSDKSDGHCQPGGLVWFFPLCVERLSVAVWIVWRCCWTGGDGLSGPILRLKEKHPGEQQSWGLGGDGAAELNLPLWQSWL